MANVLIFQVIDLFCAHFLYNFELSNRKTGRPSGQRPRRTGGNRFLLLDLN